MKLNTRHRRPAAVLCSLLFGMAQAAGAHECSTSNVAGRYGYTISGSIVSPAVGPFTSVGQIKFTEEGTLRGTQTTSVAGNFFDEFVQGTYTVQANCVGTAVVNVYHGATLARTTNLTIVWDDHQREARGLFLTPGTNITIQGRKMFRDDD